MKLKRIISLLLCTMLIIPSTVNVGATELDEANVVIENSVMEDETTGSVEVEDTENTEDKEESIENTEEDVSVLVALEEDIVEEENMQLPVNRARAVGDVAINYDNFPDVNFREYVRNEFDENSNWILSQREINSAEWFNLEGLGIESLQGIEFFSKLEVLVCQGNAITSLNLSNAPELKHLNCANNKLEGLDLTNNTKLEYLECNGNALTSLKLGNKLKLETLWCGDNALTSLDVSNAPNLSGLGFWENKITNINLDNNTKLEELVCPMNALTSLDVSNLPKLINLICYNNKLTSLNMGNKPELKYFECSGNKLTSLDLSKAPVLTYAFCSGNELTDIVMGTMLDKLLILDCEGSNLTTLPDLKNAKNLQKYGDEEWMRTSFAVNKIPTSEFQDNLPEHLLNDEVWLNEQIDSQRGIGIAIDATNFLDANFREYILEEIDYNDDGVLNKWEIELTKWIDVSERGIANLKGIELFSNLEGLSCYANKLKNLDLSKNLNLEYVECVDNEIVNLNLGNNSKLESLWCSGNRITNLDVSKLPNLKGLSCWNNQLDTLDISNNLKLEYLDCGGNKLSSLNLSKLPELRRLFCGKNQLTNLNLKSNSKLEYVWSNDNRLVSVELGTQVGSLVSLRYDNNNLKNIPNLKEAKKLEKTDERDKLTSFTGNEIPENEFRNKLPAHLLNDTVWLKEQIDGQRKSVTKYKITFNANGGSVSIQSKDVTVGETYGILPTPTRAGYTFGGWYTAKTGGTKIELGTKVNLTSAQTLYARWTANKKYTVTFNANGGKVTTKNKTVTLGTTYGTLPTGTRKNYTFKGWYTAKTGGKKIEAGTKVNLTKNQTLYAQWNLKTYTVKFNANKGSGTMKEVKLKHGTSKKLTANTFKRTGYKFTGWNTKANGKGKAYKNKASIKNENITLYAQWKINTYTIKFKGNKSTSGKMSNQKMNYNATKKLKKNTFKRKGYTFIGWNTKANGKGVAYKNKASIKNKNITLYAQWRRNK